MRRAFEPENPTASKVTQTRRIKADARSAVCSLCDLGTRISRREQKTAGVNYPSPHWCGQHPARRIAASRHWCARSPDPLTNQNSENRSEGGVPLTEHPAVLAIPSTPISASSLGGLLFISHRAGLPSLSPVDHLATFGLAATIVPCDHYGALRGVFIAVDLAAYAKAIFCRVLRDEFLGLYLWTVHNTAAINQQNVVA
jgi:hypothetical protein